MVKSSKKNHDEKKPDRQNEWEKILETWIEMGEKIEETRWWKTS